MKILVPSKITAKQKNDVIHGGNNTELVEKSKLIGSCDNIKSFTNDAPIFIPSIKVRNE